MKTLNDFMERGLFLGKFIVEVRTDERISIWVTEKIVNLSREFINNYKGTKKAFIELCELEAVK